jgi:hypothetical protein
MMVLDIGVNSSIEEISKTIKTIIMCMVIQNLLNWKLLVFKVKIISRFIWSGKRDGLIYSKIKLLCESFSYSWFLLELFQYLIKDQLFCDVHPDLSKN